MDKAQVLAFEIIQVLIEKILDIKESQEAELESIVSDEIHRILQEHEEDEEDEEDDVSSLKRVNNVRLPKNWGKVDGKKF